MYGPNDPPPFELHACQGLNTCKGHGRDESGTMPGDGDCATANDHTCAGDNDCRGQGGCGYKTDPNENACKGTGGCGSPIPAKQEFNEGGGSVWDAARAAFEARMNSTGNTPVAPAPAPNQRRKDLNPTSPDSSSSS